MGVSGGEILEVNSFSALTISVKSRFDNYLSTSVTGDKIVFSASMSFPAIESTFILSSFVPILDWLASYLLVS